MPFRPKKDELKRGEYNRWYSLYLACEPKVEILRFCRENFGFGRRSKPASNPFISITTIDNYLVFIDSRSSNAKMRISCTAQATEFSPKIDANQCNNADFVDSTIRPVYNIVASVYLRRYEHRRMQYIVRILSLHLRKSSSRNLPSLSTALPAICGPAKAEAKTSAEGPSLEAILARDRSRSGGLQEFQLDLNELTLLGAGRS